MKGFWAILLGSLKVQGVPVSNEGPKPLKEPKRPLFYIPLGCNAGILERAQVPWADYLRFLERVAQEVALRHDDQALAFVGVPKTT